MSYFRIILMAGIYLYGMNVQAGEQRTETKQPLQKKHIERAAYHIPFGSSGNRIELAILAGSKSITSVQVKSIDLPNGIHIDPAEQEVTNVQPNIAEAVVFTFSVEKSAPLNKEHELTFLISTNDTQQRKTIPIVIDRPERFELFQNYPNPFNAETVVSYLLPVNSHVTLKVYDVLGREVKVLADEVQEAGYKTVSFDANELASGMYFYRLSAIRKDGMATFAKVNRLMIVK
jgi:hypothetical protein